MAKEGYPSRKEILHGVFSSGERKIFSGEFNHQDSGIVIKALIMHIKNLRKHIVLCEKRIQRQKRKLKELNHEV